MTPRTRPIADPLKYGPTPLLTEKDRPALDLLIDRMQAELISTIRARVTAGADFLYDQGYETGELEISGFGPEIEVTPKQEYDPPKIARWWPRVTAKMRMRVRRGLMRMRIRDWSLRDYENIVCLDFDTQRLMKGLKIFDVPERRRLP